MKRTVVLGLGILVASAALFVGGSFVSSSSSAAPPGTTAAQQAADPAQAVVALRQKRKADAARNAFEDALARYGAGTATVEEVALWSRRTWEDDPDRASSTATTAYIDRAARLEREVQKRVAAGHAAKSDTLAASYFKADAEATEVTPLAIDPIPRVVRVGPCRVPLMAADGPWIRAALSQALLRAAGDLQTVERRAIRDRLGEALIADIEKDLPLSWTHMDVHMALSDAVRDVVGPERNVVLWRTTMAALWNRPLLRGFVDTVTKVFGLSPPGLLKHASRVYGHLTRDLGSTAFEPDAGESSGVVILRGFPAKRYRFQCYVEGLQGCFDSIFPLTKHAGEITVLSRDEAAGIVRYRIRWD